VLVRKQDQFAKVIVNLSEIHFSIRLARPYNYGCGTGVFVHVSEKVYVSGAEQSKARLAGRERATLILLLVRRNLKSVGEC
jgi:hypothetical protein